MSVLPIRGTPAFTVLSMRKGLADPCRCVRRLRAGHRNVMGLISDVFSDSLLYVITEILPPGTGKHDIAAVAVKALEALWDDRHLVESPAQARTLLYKSVLDLCKAESPGLDEQEAMLTVAFAEIARSMIEMEKALPKRLLRFYRLKFVLRKPDPEIAAELNLSEGQVLQYASEIRAFIGKMPKWD